MKNPVCLLASFALWIAPGALQGEIVAQWNFNNSIAPSVGQGYAMLVGGTTASFASGSKNDPTTAENTGWNTTHYPSQGTGNKAAGVQFKASTAGFAGLLVRWDHRVSATASKCFRLQYSTNGVTFVDFPQRVFALTSGSGYEAQTNDLIWIPEAEDNTEFAFRLVSEFAGETVPGGAEEYVTAYDTNRYSTAGTVRLDMVTIYGDRIIDGNQRPNISGIPDQTLRLGAMSQSLDFTIGDAEDSPEALVVEAVSSNARVIPPENISVGGYGAQRTMTVTAGYEPGVATITLRVTDTKARSSGTRFTVVVLPQNTAPFIPTINGTTIAHNSNSGAAGGTATEVHFTLWDLETPAEELAVTCFSGNAAVVPNDGQHLWAGGVGSNRTVWVNPALGAAGAVMIRVQASDGVNTSSSIFPVVVSPWAGTVFFEPFTYADGSLAANSGGLWTGRSGTSGDCEVVDGQLRLASALSEDVRAPLAAGPYGAGQGTLLYVSFKVKFLGVPRSNPEYFAHFHGGGSFRGRVYAGSSEAWPGGVRLYVANGSATNRPHAATLATNRLYTVVTRYDVDRAATVLWVNPESETTPCAVAADAQLPIEITAYGFRQESALGTTVLVDDVKVGRSFEAVTTDTPVQLDYEQVPHGLVLRWPDPTSVLQAAPDPGELFTNVPGATSPFTVEPNGQRGFYRLRP